MRTKRITLLDALEDRALFGRAFAGPSWRPWNVFLRAVFALPLEGEDLDLYRRCTGRETPPTRPAEEAFALCGRRSGKSLVSGAIVAYLAAFKKPTGLAPGERPIVLLCARDRTQARIVFGYAVGPLKSSPLRAREIVTEAAESVTPIRDGHRDSDERFPQCPGADAPRCGDRRGVLPAR